MNNLHKSRKNKLNQILYRASKMIIYLANQMKNIYKKILNLK